jgi:glyoxylase-like metal-dependent hydrolase (beta-lactamase superfamily II)
MLTIDTLVVGAMKTNCFIVYDDVIKEALIIDPGEDSEYITEFLQKRDLEPLAILATHGHFDHNLAAFSLKVTMNVPYLISKNDEFLLKNMRASAKHFLGIATDPPPKPDAYLKEGKRITVGSSFFEVIECPGHTPGSICLYNPIEKILFCGDLLFKGGSVGRYDFSYADKKDLFASINTILNLPGDTIIYPGHGEGTTIKSEKVFFSNI